MLKKNSNDLWSILDIALEEEGCPFCGQMLDNGFCKSCYSHMDNAVYHVCREMLIKKGNVSNAATDKEAYRKPREVAISELLDEFPFTLAKRIRKFNKLLKTEGVWFAHLVAYTMVKELRKDKDFPPLKLMHDEIYSMVRDQMYEFLRTFKEPVDEETRETVMNFYSIPSAELDARKVIHQMINELEREGKIKIDRGKSLCSKCGDEIDAPKTMCETCEEEEKLNARMTISSAEMPPLSAGEKEKPSPLRHGGMHVRKGK